MTGAELLVRCLENEGLEQMFGVPGEENLPVLEAILDSRIHFLQTRHEQGAAFMADVQGRITGKASVCMATLGPGATNLLTAVADANMDRAPLVAITAQADTERFHKESHQYLDLISLYRPAVKWNAQLVRPQVVPEAMRKAFKVAQTEKPGATHLDFPEDVAEAAAPAGLEPLLPQQPFPTEPSDQQIERAKKIISEARNPIILAGNGVTRSRASVALRDFAETLGIPVIETFMGKAISPTRILCVWARWACRTTIMFHAGSIGPTRSFASGTISWNTRRHGGTPAATNASCTSTPRRRRWMPPIR
jgi:acetolactate synthase I/II/III large subunit